MFDYDSQMKKKLLEPLPLLFYNTIVLDYKLC